MAQQQLFKVRDKRNRGWFWVENEYFNGFGKILGANAIAVYVSLCRHADQEQRCFPAQKEIAKELKLSERTVRNIIKDFQKYRIIEIERERTAKGKWLHNVYWLLDKTEWKHPEATIACGHPEAKSNRNQRQPLPPNKTHINNTQKKASFKKRYFRNMEMRQAQGKWWCIPKDGGDWLEFAGKLEQTELK